MRGSDMNLVAWEAIDGIPTYKLFIDGQWVQSSRNSVVEEPPMSSRSVSVL
jgi:hypothetical protein